MFKNYYKVLLLSLFLIVLSVVGTFYVMTISCAEGTGDDGSDQVIDENSVEPGYSFLMAVDEQRFIVEDNSVTDVASDKMIKIPITEGESIVSVDGYANLLAVVLSKAGEAWSTRVLLIDIETGSVLNTIESGDEYIDQEGEEDWGYQHRVIFSSDGKVLYVQTSFGTESSMSIVMLRLRDSLVLDRVGGRLISVLPDAENISSEEYKKFEGDLLVANKYYSVIGGSFHSFVSIIDSDTFEKSKENILMTSLSDEVEVVGDFYDFHIFE